MIDVVDYDPSWPRAFQTAATSLRTAGDSDWVIEHIGSTSIPGMRAKPVIDIAVRLPSLDEMEVWRRPLVASGWLPIREQPLSHRVMVRENGGRRTHIAHFFAEADWPTCHQRIFRDWLRGHPDDRASYLAVKTGVRDLNAEEYSQQKEPVVLAIVNRARAARGLPPLATLDATP